MRVCETRLECPLVASKKCDVLSLPKVTHSLILLPCVPTCPRMPYHTYPHVIQQRARLSNLGREGGKEGRREAPGPGGGGGAPNLVYGESIMYYYCLGSHYCFPLSRPPNRSPH